MIHDLRYYRALFERAAASDNLRLLLLCAWHEGDLLGGIVVALWHRDGWSRRSNGGQATYLYGASADRKRNLMAGYTLQWRAMQMAREAGCVSYDLFGIPTNEDPRHPMAGLYRFKTGFGGRIVRRYGAWDYRCRPLAAGLLGMAEGLRRFYFKRLRRVGK